MANNDESEYTGLSDDNQTSDNDDVASFKDLTSDARKALEGESGGEDLLADPGAAISKVAEKTTSKAKKTKKAAKEDPKYSWTSDVVDAIIKEWESRPLLFDCTHEQYHLKDKRKLAIEQIRIRLSTTYEVEPVPTIDDIIKKMNSLRTHFSLSETRNSNRKAP